MKAIVLISGGLDSSLAIKAIQLQGIEVIAVHCLIPFVPHSAKTITDSPAAQIARNLGCQFRLVVLGNEYLRMFKNPPHGYGKNLNPCIDCKILMLRHAKKIMEKEGALFVATGEVIGQRPMSQYRDTLLAIAKKSGLAGLVVRPLSAKVLPMTLAQKKGWLKDEFLYDINGRGRKCQMELARQWGIEEYPWPGGGCLLTDPHFCKRLSDLLKHNQCRLANIELLKLGRHFRINRTFKLVVGRDEAENKKLLALAKKNDIIFEPCTLAGPTALGRGRFSKKNILTSCRIITRYITQDTAAEVKIIDRVSKKEEVIRSEPFAEDGIKKFRL